MARTLNGKLTGKAGATQRHEDASQALEDAITLSPIDHMEVDLSVARKMHATLKRDGRDPKSARKFYMRAYRLQKKLDAIRRAKAPTPPTTDNLTPTKASEVLCAWMSNNWDAIPEVRF